MLYRSVHLYHNYCYIFREIFPYEETLRRIEQREEEYAKKGLKRSFCREIRYPYHVHLYYGERQIVVAEMEEYYINYKPEKKEIPRFKFETLSDMKISFKIPQGDGYTDEEDYSSSEIYQGYSYSKSEEDDEPVGHIYFSIAAELNCDLSSENVLNVFEEEYGATTQYEYIECEHSIFKYRAEIIGKNIHRILYLNLLIRLLLKIGGSHYLIF